MAPNPSLLRVLCVLNYILVSSHAFQHPIGAVHRQSLIPRVKPLDMAIERDSSTNNRRLFIEQVAVAAFSTATLSQTASAAENQPQITHKVSFDVRISRSDGTFYVRDTYGSNDTSDEPFYGSLIFGLYGKTSPNHVEHFLSYINVPYEIDNPLPSYSRSRFTTLDISSGLLIGGSIPGLDVTTLAGGNVLEYGSKVIPAKLWLEDTSAEKISHGKKGLLTHRNLDVTPTFGITTIGDSTSLDASHTVFGCVLEDNGGFLDKVLDLPVLTDSGKVSRTEMSTVAAGGSGDEASDIGGALASSLFTAQRKVFRDAAKTFGDTRLDKVYDGKLLRRVDVTKVAML